MACLSNDFFFILSLDLLSFFLDSTELLELLVTDKGRQMKVDLVIPCTGLKVNTEAYRKSLGQSYFIGEYW